MWSRVFASLLVIGAFGCGKAVVGTNTGPDRQHPEGGIREAGPTATSDAGVPSAPPALSTEYSLTVQRGGLGATFPDEPALAHGSGVYLMAWVDERLDNDAQVSDVFIERFTESGTPLDDHPVLVGMGLQDEMHPSVAFDGSNFLVAWFRYAIPPYNGGGDTVGVRVAPSGAVLDQTPIPIVANGFGPAVASRAPGWLVGAADNNDSAILRFAEVGADGKVGTLRTVNAQADSYGTIATGNGTVLTVGQLAATLVDATWTASPMMSLVYPSVFSGVTWNGDAYYVASTVPNALLTRIAANGAITSAALSGGGGGIAATSNRALLAYWTRQGDLAAEFADLPSMQAGTEWILEPAPGPVTTLQPMPAVALGDTGFGVGWARTASDPLQGAPKLAIVGDADGGTSQTTSVPLAWPDQLSPVVAADDVGFSLVWTENTDGGSEVRLMRFDASGAPIDVDPVSIAKGRNPVVARRAGRTLIFWEDSRFVVGARIDDAETMPHLGDRPSDASGRSPFGNSWSFAPAVAATADGFVLAFSVGSDTTPTIGTSLVNPDWPDPSVVSSESGGFGYGCRLAGAGAGYLQTSGMLGSDHQFVGEIAVALHRAASSISMGVTLTDGAEPSIAYGANRVFVAYRSGATDSPKTIRAKVFDATNGAAVGAGMDFDVGSGHGDRPSAAFDGRNFWVAFRLIDGGRSDIVGARISPDGTLVDSPPIAISEDPEAHLSTSIAANAAGRVLIAYSRYDHTVGAARVKIRWAN